MRKRNAEQESQQPEEKTNQKRFTKRGKPAEIKTSEVGQSKSGRGWLRRIKCLFLTLFVVYVSVPFLIRLFPALLANVVYLSALKAPFFVDLQHPEDLQLNHTANFYLSPEEGVRIGVWHTVPDSRWQEAQGEGLSWYESALRDQAPIIIYLHGNGGTRAVGHRVELLKVLSAAGFHVLALDYRGFADSTGDPSEEGMTADGVYLYRWVKERSSGSPVCFWGHSLGTGVATNAACRLQDQGSPPDAVILEAPYTNIREEGAHHPFAQIYRIFPAFEYFFLDTMALSNIFFPNDENLKSMSSPLMILHAEDDHMVPFEMSRKLYEIALKSQHSQENVKLVLFDRSLGYRHNNIYKDPKLPALLWEFLHPVAEF
ncbi:lysophosphatidylserine lipase ABHD12-like [Acipenser oxyrinchus oxyrinchus]|uniref:Lysophosphatidylserine lipase ABHD12-like n=1 Tax=Acipenser oxyrinchus oxyrinchus TaxID=40147 RepID=A0AAD8CY12_ACIOX|nr:lysophosphatidylserine lipase ABHD12-like [Acipenser oxyrinchus oxyrinchus]